MRKGEKQLGKSKCKVCFGSGMIKKFSNPLDKKGVMTLCGCVDLDKVKQDNIPNAQN